MEVYIKDISLSNCYTRFGKVIPKIETKIDIIKYFGRDVLAELKKDKNIIIIEQNPKNIEEVKKEVAKKEEDAEINKKVKK